MTKKSGHAGTQAGGEIQMFESRKPGFKALDSWFLVLGGNRH